jgi:MoaA/NifB/PqqE/SkfB family radical SAM enzyme
MKKTPQMTLENRINLGDAIPLDTPLVVYVEPSSHCNLACKFCPHYISPEGFEKGLMSYDLFKKICDDMAVFPTKVKLLRLCGLGDSLFNKQITSFVEYAGVKRSAERIEMISNGLLLDEKHFHTLALYLDRLIVSVEGLNEADYLEFTDRKVNFNRFVERLTAFSQYPGRTCTLHIKVHNSAVATKERLQKFYEIFSPIADELYTENLINLWPELVSNLGINSGHRFVESEVKNQIACAQIFKSMQVNFDGKVMPCCIDWKVVNVIGDMAKSTLRDIWVGESLRRIQLKHLNGERSTFLPCAGCTMNEESDIDFFDDKLDTIKSRLYERYLRV